MDSVGIICEYNPFHNGHIHHLNKVKEMFPKAHIILIMSGNFTQRGLPSILNKWDKTEIALNYGVDLVIELPFPFSTQSADIFAKGAISLLKELKVSKLVFGSECNDINKLTELANISLYDKSYQARINKYLDDGLNYPTALSKAFNNKTINTPNDLLGLSYIKEIIRIGASIEPFTIQRTNSYHSKELSEISSATSIREALLEGKDIENSVPELVLKKLESGIIFQNDYFQLLKYKIISTPDLNIFQTVDEGLGARIKKYIQVSNNWEELVQNIKTKRYTYNKINRMLTHILCNFTKEQAANWKEIEYIRVLGFSKKGQGYLKSIKKELKLPLITNFSKDKASMLEYEQTITNIYASILPKNREKSLIEAEYKNKPKMREF